MKAAWLPQDNAVRQRIISDVEENMCVEAGAGTGKTTVLVERIVQALRSSDVRVEELVVITFTEKAAAELSARVRRGLERARRETVVEVERQRLAAAIRGLNAAHIETIHAFAASLLRERPVEAKLDPGFEVLDELPQQLAFEGAYSDWITDETAPDVPPPALVEAMNLGLEWRHVREAAERLNRHRDVLPLPPFAADPPDILGVLTAFETAFERFDKIADTIRDETNTTFTEFARMREACAGLAALRSHPESLATAICQAKVPDVQHGSKGQWFPPSNGTVAKDALKVIKRALDDTRIALRQSATAQLVRWLQGFVEYYDGRRRAEGKADFDDLLVWARDLLRDNEEVRAYYASKYRRIFVDEFQDTDPLQAEMIVRLCAAEDPGPAWRSARLRRGSLFVVGDPKQSIYRFRRADIGMYDDVKRQVFGGGGVAEITQNFRSSQPIIDWVNTVFEQLILEREGVQPGYTPLVPLPDLPGGGPLVVRGTVPPPESGSGYQPALRRAEAQALAALIEQSISTGVWTLRDRDDATRPAEYRDVAVLIPSRTDLAIYEEAFAVAGVPYRHEGGRTFFQRQEVRELIAILRAIDDPGDGVSAVAALRSPGFACSDEDLFLHREQGRFDYRSLRADAAGLVADSLRALRELASMRTEVTLPELVRTVIDRLRLVEFAMLQHQGEQAAANLLKIIDQARAFAAIRRGAGLREFVRWMRENVVREADETDAAVTEETDDTVRVLTIHAAKGLEFPVVVFANMNTERADRTNVIVTRGDGRGTLELKLGPAINGFLTPGYAAAENDESAHSTAEQLRLLYVAATRACDHLVVPFLEIEGRPLAVRTEADAKSLNQHLQRAGAHEAETFIDTSTLPLAVGEPPALRIATSTNGDASQDIIDAREIWQIGRSTRLEQGSAKLLVHTATSLKGGMGDALFGEQEIRRGKAREFGVAVHQMLERIDLSRADGIVARAAAVAAEFGLQGREDEIARCARNAIKSEIVARAVASPRMLREVAFTAPLPDAHDRGLAEGRIDLLFVENGEVVVVDFKTDDVSGNELDRRVMAYRTQALVYAWAATRTTNMPVREVVFLFARLPAERSFRVDAAFLAEAEALFRPPAIA